MATTMVFIFHSRSLTLLTKLHTFGEEFSVEVNLVLKLPSSEVRVAPGRANLSFEILQKSFRVDVRSDYTAVYVKYIYYYYNGYYL